MEPPAPETLRRVRPQFFVRDPREVAQALLGTLIVSSARGAVTGGRIVETEAYLGSDDPGSHAATKGMTARNSVMYGPPGSVYVYFTYGNHHMLNLVCSPEGVAGAVLIRALEPLIGVGAMRSRRGRRNLNELTSGPGRLAEALGVDLSDNGTRLGEGRLVVYHWEGPAEGDVAVSGRVGLSSGHELDYRYYLANSPFVSRARTGARTAKRARGVRDERTEP